MTNSPMKSIYGVNSIYPGKVRISWNGSLHNYECANPPLTIEYWKIENKDDSSNSKLINNFITTSVEIPVEFNVTYVFKVMVYFNNYESECESEELLFKTKNLSFDM